MRLTNERKYHPVALSVGIAFILGGVWAFFAIGPNWFVAGIAIFCILFGTIFIIDQLRLRKSGG